MGAQIARRAARAHDFLRRTLAFSPALTLCAIDRADWPRHAETDTYGVTHVIGDSDLVTGTQPADAWNDVRDYLAQALPEPVVVTLARLCGNDPRHPAAPSLAGIAYALIAHDLAHLYAQSANVVFPRPWLAEAFANYALVSVLAATDTGMLARVGALAAATASLSEPTPSLSQFDAEFGRMPVIPSVLAHLALTREVLRVHAQSGAAPLRRMFDCFRDGANRPLDDRDLAKLLVTHVHPAFADMQRRLNHQDKDDCATA